MKIHILAMAILIHTVIAHTMTLPCEQLGGAMGRQILLGLPGPLLNQIVQRQTKI